MAAIGPRKRLALDTNLLLELAEERDWAHEFRERLYACGDTDCVQKWHLPAFMKSSEHVS